MPWVAVEPAARSSCLAVAGARWARLSAARPDLAPAASLQGQLVTRALDVLDAVEHGHVPRLSLPPRYVAAKLGKGVPALTAEPIPVPAAILAPALLDFCQALDIGGAGEPAAHIRAALAEGRIEPGSLLTASLTRDQASIRKGAEHMGLSPDLLWLIAELAVSPFVYALQQRVFPRDNPTLAAALDAWSRGYCPACGSWPALAESVDGQAVLRCSFCAFAWMVPPGRCVYCRAAAPTFTALVPDVARPDRRLGVCDGCHAYLKVVELDSLSPFPLVAISDLETTELDIDAMRRGYGRPAMADRTQVGIRK